MKSLCVYCGSNPGRLEAYSAAGRQLAELMVARGIKLVYGGASIGVMGAVADAVLEAGGEAIGVIPESLVRREVAHKNLTELHITNSMHERKTLMAELSDGFIALPGGIGTLEEIFEIWTWAQLGIHAKPCGLLNVAGYYDSLTQFLDTAVAERFIDASHRSILVVEDDPGVLLRKFEEYTPPNVQQWVEQAKT